MKYSRILGLTLGMVTFVTVAQAQSFNLLWESTTFRSPSDSAQSVAALRNRVIAGEVLGRADNSGQDVLVKAFNPTTGHLVWTDEISDGYWVRVETAGDLAVAAIARTTPELLLRGYDLKTGDIRWTAHTSLDLPKAVLVRNGRIAVVGYSQVTDPSTGLFLVAGVILVHDLGTGRELWRVEEVQPPIIPLKDTIFLDLDDQARNLIVIGTVGQTELHVRSYRFTDGFLRWEQVVPNTFAMQVEISGHEAVIAGFSNGATYLVAFDIGTGHLLWQAAPEMGRAFTWLRLTATQVIVSGTFTIQAYDRLSHEVVWRKPLTADQAIPHIRPIGRFLAVAEIDSPLFGPPTTSLQLLDPATGDTVFDLPLSTAIVRDALVFQNRLILVGSSDAGAFVKVFAIEPVDP